MKTTRALRMAQNGAGIVETMIGILIGMVVVLVIYNVFALAEGYKRTAVGTADAQATGLYAQFVLSREIANAGNGLLDSGIASVVRDLQQCTNIAPNWLIPPAPTFGASAPVCNGAGSCRIRPYPVLIHDGGGPNASDAIIVTYSTAAHVVSPVQFVNPPVTGVTPFYVQSPTGFIVPKTGSLVTAADAPFRVIVLNSATQTCEMTTVTAAVVGSPGDPTGTGGTVTLTHPLVTGLYAAGTPPDGATLLNLGQDGESVRTLYDVVNDQLRSTDLFAAAPANPIAQNVVLMKVQYGIDCAANGVVLWTSATASNVCGVGDSYTEDDLMRDPVADPASNDKKFGTPGATIARMRAIRIGIVVRSDEPDLKDAALKGQTGVLFDCSAHNATCQGRITLNNAVLTDGYRFRYYETVVPMRNAIWNNGT
jgi:type IV pilus assembly protein PilW